MDQARERGAYRLVGSSYGAEMARTERKRRPCRDLRAVKARFGPWDGPADGQVPEAIAHMPDRRDAGDIDLWCASGRAVARVTSSLTSTHAPDGRPKVRPSSSRRTASAGVRWWGNGAIDIVVGFDPGAGGASSRTGRLTHRKSGLGPRAAGRLRASRPWPGPGRRRASLPPRERARRWPRPTARRRASGAVVRSGCATPGGHPREASSACPRVRSVKPRRAGPPDPRDRAPIHSSRHCRRDRHLSCASRLAHPGRVAARLPERLGRTLRAGRCSYQTARR